MPRRAPANFAAPCLAAAALTQAALAQTAITIDVENPVLMPGESTVVTMYAGFDPSDHAMALVITDLLTSVGSTGWADDRLVAPMDGPGSDPGGPSATGFDAITAGQLHFPPTSGIFADDTNPIAFWRATYTAPSIVDRPFEISLMTDTERYDVYFDYDRAATESRLAELTEGAATIRVVPAPASALVLAGGVLAWRRRR